ncbi:hypothetical protein DV096_10645 [Bradymonadaceae bacterium TMQ3]|nr:hypothetical protein DV096_10645 [Bradymonadaceae bacterium TMQ3]TXC75932.1 hypothetical protein FRC91_10550 [Bradymonadales bacterium TMQ1]
MVFRLREERESPVVATYKSLHDEDLSFDELIERLESPSARLLEATALFLVELARLGDIPRPKISDYHQATRRLGFIAERLSTHPELPESVQKRLKAFADQLYANLAAPPAENLGFSKTTSPARIRRLQRHADAIDERWRVWGQVDLRVEFLQ